MRTLRHKKPENFLSGLARNGHGIVEEAPLSEIERADEALVMGLRLAEGVDVGAITGRFRHDPVDWPQVERLVESRHLSRTGTRITLTDSGRLLLDYILGRIAAAEPLSAAAG